MSKASDILYDLLCYLPLRNYHGKPGAVIERLPKAAREELKKLTAEDLANMRPPDYYDE